MSSEMELIAENEFRSRLTELIGHQKPFEWAKSVGIPSSTFDRIWNHSAIPKAQYLLAISQACNVSVDWLLKGGTEDQEHTNEGLIWLPMLRSESGENGEELSAHCQAPISRDFVGIDQSDIDQGYFCAIRASGDTMYPTVDEGDIAVIDKRNRKVSGGIMAIRWDGGLHVRRVVSTLGGAVIINDNQRYPNQELSKAEMEHLDLVGEVIWVGRNLR